MRTKQELMKDVRDDINNPAYKENAPFWVAYHTTEVLIDIRDILDKLHTLITIVQSATPHPD